MPKLRPLLLPRLLAFGMSAAAYWGLAYAVPRQSFGWVLALFGIAFVAYAGLLRLGLSLRAGLAAALLLRLLWLPALPALSDDYHRFRWDGILLAAGQNPYLSRPDELMAEKDAANGSLALEPLYARLNSPHYYSVYPPVCQAVFGLAGWWFPDKEQAAVVLMRLVLLGAEALTAWLLLALLGAWRLPAQRALIYLLNPLVIVELTGNLHFEALLICLVLATFWLLLRGRRMGSAVALGLAVGTKLLPLLLLPLLVRRLGWRWLVQYGLVVAATLAVLFAPFISADMLANVGRSLNLYFHSFEFNASLYYLLRAWGQWYTGYNQIAVIGTGLALAVVALVLLISWRERTTELHRLPPTLLLLLTGYYLLATVVHPWYLTPLVALSVFTRYRFALIWSALVVLSYSAYQSSVYAENLLLVAAEYLILLTVLAYDLTRTRPDEEVHQYQSQ
ncbi:glycosyltransferase 87 family protein [Hymenobacter sp. BT175]|uniref:glycosyltransferase 87 family protein n=1 Tax=Hymenobacter translucens TaxID=2886507 RepID=UPI001D0DF3DF|nr:glycosyltransferase 87 family protein [Hymenobacter translucens]MCC2545137.1 glycosyltransferase 87 family protein [Hymenobacter translucens]